MNQVKSEAPTFGENVGAFGKLTITWAGGRMAVWFSATIIVPARAFVNYSASKTVCQAFIVPARAFVNPFANHLCNMLQGGRLWAV